LFQLSGKRLLQTFIHSRPLSVNEGGVPLNTIQESTSDNMNINEENENSDDDDMPIENESTYSVECIGFSPNASGNGPRWIASGGMDMTLKVWDLDNGNLRCTCSHTSTVTELRWHDNLPVVCVSTLNGLITVWDTRAGLQLAELSGHNAQITSFSMSVLPPMKYSDSASTSTLVSLPTAAGDNEQKEMLSIVTASDDNVSRVFLIDVMSLL
jgi:WD40 repeat protein